MKTSNQPSSCLKQGVELANTVNEVTNDQSLIFVALLHAFFPEHQTYLKKATLSSGEMDLLITFNKTLQSPNLQQTLDSINNPKIELLFLAYLLNTLRGSHQMSEPLKNLNLNKWRTLFPEWIDEFDSHSK